jgi:hypothetical protein
VWHLDGVLRWQGSADEWWWPPGRPMTQGGEGRGERQLD